MLLLCLMHLGCFGQIGGDEEDGPAIQGAATATTADDGFIRVPPYRLVDTRESSALAAKSTRCWQIGGKNGVPASAVAASINLTAVGPAAGGYLSAFPYDANDSSVPEVSTLNYTAGENVANGAIVALGEGGKICVHSLALADVIVDVSGYFAGTDGFSAVDPFRLVDTRNSSAVQGDKSRCWKVTGQGGVPSSAMAVSLNLAAIRPSDRGFLTAYPYDSSDSSIPPTSNLNYAEGQVVANGAIVTVGDEGKVCVYSKSRSDLVVDVSGYFGPSSSFIPIVPIRKVDTRPSSVPIAGSTRCVKVAGKNGIPSSVSAVAVNLSAVGPVESGYLLARPAGEAGISTSTLNYSAGEVRANNAIVQPGAYGKICIYTRGTTDYVMDIVGYWPGEVNPDPITHPHTFDVSTKGQLLSALEKARAGDTLNVAKTANINLNGHKEIYIPGGVTIQGGRSASSAGALIRTTDTYQHPTWGTWNLFRTAGDGVTVKDLRLRGPDGFARPGFMAAGIYLRHANTKVQNSDLHYWPAAAVSVSGPGDALIDGNLIHSNIRTGRGYGVVVGSTESPTIITNNVFRRNRHSVAGNGYGSYEVAYNVFQDSDSNGMMAVVDMHGANEHTLDNSTHQAGIDIHIHHNDFEFRHTLAIPLVGIRGIPKNPAIIENNCVAGTDYRWVNQSDMFAFSAPNPSYASCYDKAGTWLCHTPSYGADLKNIVVGNNSMNTPSGCR